MIGGAIRLGPKDYGNVIDVLTSGQLSYGKYSKQFETRWSHLNDRQFSVFMNSGTSALQVGLHAMKVKYGWKDGAEVLVPALTFVASVNTIIQNNLTPVLVDIEPGTYSMSTEQMEKVAGEHPNAVAVMPVHLYGCLTDMDDLMYLASHFNLRVIEDSCETVGAELNGRRNFGSDIACFSTYACHVVQTGVGGFASTDDPHLAALIRSLANHGRDGIFFDPNATGKQLIERRFKFEHIGYSYRATELEAAIGCAQLDSIEDQLAARRRNAAFLRDALNGLPLRLPEPRGVCSWMFFPMLTERRDELCQYLERNGIETRPFVPLTNQPVYKGRFQEEDYPAAAQVNREGFYVWIHPWMTGQELAVIEVTIRNFFQGR